MQRVPALSRAVAVVPVVAALVTGGTALTGAAGCADSGDEAIMVMKNVHPDDEDCVSTAAANEVGIARGSLEVLVPSGYLFFAQLKSRITALAGQEDQRTIFTSGANVDITFPGSEFFDATELAELRERNLTRFKQPFVTPISPNGGLTDVPFDLIPEALVEEIAIKADLTKRFRIEAQATFTVIGEMAGGEVTSQPYTYGVTIGNNVSINNVGACAGLADGFMAQTGYACNPFQDGVVDCCTSGNNLLCPARK